MRKRTLFFVPVALVLVAFAACDDSVSVKEPSPDGGSGTPDSGSPIDSGASDPTDCFDNPTTHYEIINACTTAVKIAKNPILPKLLPDGGLPPLQ